MAMKMRHLLALSAVLSAMLILAASAADAQRRTVIGGWTGLPRDGGGMRGVHGLRGAFPVFVTERQAPVIIEREVAREVPAGPPAPAEPPAPAKKHYVIGASYASLPAGCMKLIEDGVSYYYCGGEWYRQVRADGRSRYLAVAQP